MSKWGIYLMGFLICLLNKEVSESFCIKMRALTWVLVQFAIFGAFTVKCDSLVSVEGMFSLGSWLVLS